MEREPGRAQRIAALIISAAMVWYMIPEHRRQLILMKAAHMAQRTTGRAAMMLGRAGMSDELAGRAGDARRNYDAALHLSRLRDTFGRALESIRP